MVDTNELRSAIEAAEHKPEDWNVSALTFGAAAKRIDHPSGVAAPLAPWGEEIIGTFPWKRDGWLAVAAVRALPALLDELDMLRARVAAVETARALDEYHEDMGPVTWWAFPVQEASWIGAPDDSDWPGYHTHFTTHPPIPANCDEDGNLLPAGDGEGGGNGRG